NIVPMSTQVSQFEQLVSEKRNYEVSKSLYCFAIGSNDISNYLSNSTSTPKEFLSLLLTKFNEYITRLYRVGARKFLVLDIPALGCTPNSRLIDSNGECLKAANLLAEAYNTALKPLIDQLNQQLEELSIILLNSFDSLLDMIQHGEAY
ncbi:hypothetical protein KI387_034222, partial [Taxus chinensis]